MPKLLVVDDEPSICWGITRLAEGLGHDVTSVSSAEQALESVATRRPDLIVLDVRLPGMDGLTAIEHFRRRIGPVPIIVMTAYGDLKTAVAAIRSGALEYVIKPFDLAKMERALHRAFSRSPVEAATPSPPRPVGGMVGSSAALQEVFKQLALAAASDVGVLLHGESGTGKELAARAIHSFSDRAEGPFVAVNVASLNPTIAESELFGHVRGAFTGADQDRVGLLVQADQGTLFLDEVADIPLPVQVKLLRALEHDEVVPVGASRPVATHFRVVSATHQELLAQVRDGRFRHDLYFRLGAFRVELPPLRERPDDIRELAEHFLQITRSSELGSIALSEASLDELRDRPWYGNVRELRNAIEHAVIVARDGRIDPEHFPPPAAAAWHAGDPAPTEWDGSNPAHSPSSIEPVAALDDQLARLVEQWARRELHEDESGQDIYQRLLERIEPAVFQAAMTHCQGQCAAAARLLGLHRTTLRKKLDSYGLGDD